MKWDDSIKAAAGRTGKPVELFRRAKALGSPGFENSRVCPDLVFKFIAENPEKFVVGGDAIPLKDQKLNEEIRKLKIKNDKDEGKMVARTEVAASVRQTLSAVGPILEAKLQNEWPMTVSRLDPPQCRKYGKELTDEILKQFEELERLWPS